MSRSTVNKHASMGEGLRPSKSSFKGTDTKYFQTATQTRQVTHIIACGDGIATPSRRSNRPLSIVARGVWKEDFLLCSSLYGQGSWPNSGAHHGIIIDRQVRGAASGRHGELAAAGASRGRGAIARRQPRRERPSRALLCMIFRV